MALRDPATGDTHRLRVASVVDADWVMSGVMISSVAARTYLGRDAVEPLVHRGHPEGRP